MATKKDALDRFADEANKDPRKAIALILWLNRHRNPEMAVQVSEKDIEGFAQCVDYLDVKPEIVIVRPQGHPGTPGAPALGKRKAVPQSAAEGPRPFVTVNLVAKGTMNSIKPIENDEDGAKLRDQADALRRFRDKAPALAAQLRQDAAAGQFSTSTINEAAEALQALARA